MKFQPCFDAVTQKLLTLGLKLHHSSGVPVDEQRILEAEQSLGFILPTELRSFIVEMGDGYQFGYDAESITGSYCDFYSFEIARLCEMVSEFYSHQDIIRQQIAEGLGGDLEQRLHMLPIYGLGSGGSVICINTDSANGEIWYYDLRYGPSVLIDTSFRSWVKNWGRFCFSDPLHEGTDEHCCFNSYLATLEGDFDWNPSRFAAIFDCESGKLAQ